MSTIETAITIAARAHAGTVDKQAKPYVLHPLRVMLGVEGEAAQIVAVLHDVVEDTEVAMEDLAAAGFAEEVLDALGLVTHAEGVPYADYVIACKANPIARQVKLSDLRDNASLNRVLLRPDRLDVDANRVQKYVLSYRFLQDELEESDYRAAMRRLQP